MLDKNISNIRNSKQREQWLFANSPIQTGSTVTFDSYETMMNNDAEYIYGRFGSPTTKLLCQNLTELEGGKGTILTCSGLAALSAIFLSLVQTDSHILISENCYETILNFARKYLTKLGVAVETFQFEQVHSLQTLLRPNTSFVFIDIPGKLNQDVFDVADVKQAIGSIPLIVDNTWASPINFNPIKFGADIVIHSLSKYVGGHSDTIAGSITVGNSNLYDSIDNYIKLQGQYCSGNDAHMLLRGLKTLPVRMDRHYANAMYVCYSLLSHSVIDDLYFPPLESNTAHRNWRKQFKSGSGLVRFAIKQQYEKYLPQIFNNLRQIKMGWGWGGTESLISCAQFYKDGQLRYIVKLNVGLEQADLIVGDLTDALNSAHRC